MWVLSSALLAGHVCRSPGLLTVATMLRLVVVLVPSCHDAWWLLELRQLSSLAVLGRCSRVMLDTASVLSMLKEQAGWRRLQDH
jgi:hypothetical protein